MPRKKAAPKKPKLKFPIGSDCWCLLAEGKQFNLYDCKVLSYNEARKEYTIKAKDCNIHRNIIKTITVSERTLRHHHKNYKEIY